MLDIHERDLIGEHLRLAAIESKGAGTPIVLLHGAGSNAHSWMPLIRALEGRRVLAVDLPSHGKSDTATSWNLHQTADLVLKTVRPALGAEPAIFGGHSWGGKLSGLIAATHPGACAGLVLIDPSPSHAVPVDCQGFVDDAFGVELCPYESPAPALQAARAIPRYRHWDADMAVAVRRGLAQRADGSWSLRPTRDELCRLAEGVLWEDASALLATNSAIPTLLVTAGESVWQIQTNVAVYAEARHVTLAGSHWIHMDDAAGVSAAVSKWLDEFFPI